MHRSDYCLAGMFRDLFLFRRVDKLRTLVLLVVVTMLLFEGARLLGLLPNYPFPLFYAPSAANVAGGLLFGVGMVLAGGCVVGTLYRMGAGSLISAVAFIGLIVGSAGYAEIFPFWSAFAKQTTFFPGKITLPQIIGVEPTVPVLLIAAAGGALVLRWQRQGAFRRATRGRGRPAAVAGRPAARADQPALRRPRRDAARHHLLLRQDRRLDRAPGAARRTSLRRAFSRPSRCTTGTRSPAPISRAVPDRRSTPSPRSSSRSWPASCSAAPSPRCCSASGTSAAASPAGSWFRRFAGGVIMGFASRMAPTCNVWHLMGGLPMLAASSFLFLAGLLPGAWLGGRLLTSFVIPRTAAATNG